MRNLIVICKKELASYFYSPVAYVVITIFLLISGYFFFNLLLGYADISQKILSNQSDPYIAQYLAQYPLNSTERIFRPLFGDTSIILLLLLPLLTMRLLAEEKKSGTFELLLTYPLRDIETVLGKFCAGLIVFAVMFGLTLIYPLFLKLLEVPRMGTGVEFGPLLSGYLGLFLMGSAFIAIGLLASALTSNQIIAAVLAFGALLLSWLIGFSADSVGPMLGGILRDISLLEHFENFSKGLITSQDVIFYVNVTVFALFLTLRALESHKWRG
jgi:ABC-2 type transport system permease protein